MKIFKYNILKYALIAGITTASTISLTSCRQELDINADPNNPSDVSIASLLTGSQIGLGYVIGGEGTRIPASIVQHYAGHRSQPLEYARYEINPASTDGVWQYSYNVLMDLKALEKKAEKSGDNTYVGISKILQAYTFSVLTDLFGDIPFSEALQGSGNITPAYDKQENIYPALIKMLEEGIALIKTNQGEIPVNSDIIYNGNAEKWERLANSLKLRLLNHQSKIDANLAKSFLDTNPKLIDSYTDNAQVVFGSSASNSNPIYQFDELSGRKDQAVSSTIIDKMKSLSDPRIPVYFNPVKNGTLAGQYIGNKPGGNEDDSGERLFSRVGSFYASATSPVVIMSAAEVNFIKSEIYHRNSDNSNAKTAYETAITQDFSALGLSSSASSYLSNANVAYNGSLERIMEQKWLTLFQASYESWVDWRRTGYPTLSPSSNNRTSNIIPRSLSYPQKEINVNGKNLSAGPGIPILYESLKNRVWWDKN